MAMVSCRECGGSVSSEAEKCPHCGIGFPDSTQRWKQFGLGVVVCVILLAVFSVLARSGS
jgi:RNA polymerase subunit RPABC4/transcription elongation factor Spt4